MEYKTTREQLQKIDKVPCLYRHNKNKSYYAVKKINGKIKTHALDTSNCLKLKDTEKFKVEG